MATEQLTFPGSTGATLAGVLHRPEGSVRGSILLAHCFTCSKDLHTMTRLARGLAEGGYAVLRFDFTGLGESEGEFATTTVANDVRDVVAAATALIEHGFGPCGLLGHSMGGAAVLLATQRLHTVRSVVTIGAPSTPAHIRHLFPAAADEGSERVTVRIGGRDFEVARSFLDELDAHDQQGAVAQLQRPLLVIHAVDDQVVEVGEGERIFAAASQPKGFQPLIGADHLISDRGHAEHALSMVRGWFDATL
ncbi:MAG: alpha/beta hydrolase family protein [Nitriliruptoraceae bacterium]